MIYIITAPKCQMLRPDPYLFCLSIKKCRCSITDLGRFFIRNEYRTKGQRPDLTPIITKHRDRFGHIDFGLRIADLFFPDLISHASGIDRITDGR